MQPQSWTRLQWSATGMLLRLTAPSFGSYLRIRLQSQFQ